MTWKLVPGLFHFQRMLFKGILKRAESYKSDIRPVSTYSNIGESTFLQKNEDYDI